MEKFNQRLKKAMKMRNISQNELCQLTDIPKSAMSQYMSGVFKPKSDRLAVIAEALEVNSEWLLGIDVFMEQIPFKLYPHEVDNTDIACPRCGCRANKYIRTNTIVFDDEKSNGFAIEFCCEHSHTFYWVIESYNDKIHFFQQNDIGDIDTFAIGEHRLAELPVDKINSLVVQGVISEDEGKNRLTQLILNAPRLPDEHISEDRNNNDTEQYILDCYNQMDEEGKRRLLEYIELIAPKFSRNN